MIARLTLYARQIQDRLKRLAALSLYWRTLIGPNRWRVAALLGMGLVGSLLEASVLGLTVPVLQLATAPGQLAQNPLASRVAAGLARGGVPLPPEQVLFALIILVSLLFLIRGVFEMAQQYWTVSIAMRIKLNTRSALFSNTLRTQYDALVQQSRGGLLNDIYQPADATYVSIKNVIIVLTSLLSILVLTGLMFCLSTGGTLVVGSVALGGAFLWRKILTRLSTLRGDAIYEAVKAQSKWEVDAIDGIRLVKSSVLEDVLTRMHRSLLDAEVPPTLQVTLFRNAPAVVNELVACAIIFGLGAMVFVWPASGLTFPVMVAMLLTLRRISPLVSRMNAAEVELAKYRKALEVLNSAFARPQETEGGQTPQEVREIIFDGVSFRYPGKREEALRGLTLTLRQNTVTALVGPTGSGKTTLANLLLRLFDPTEGAITLNNSVELRHLDRRRWRNQIGYVSQDLFLFNASIEENIALWNPSISRAQVEAAAEIAQLDEFIRSLPEGYGTLVGDRGVRLSGGQCQRVALARAVLRKPSLLILDEATSALDNLTEKAVYRAIQTLRQGAIVLVIAHRMSTIREADQIIVLKNGLLSEKGTHRELLRQSGLYAQLYGAEASPVAPS